MDGCKLKRDIEELATTVVVAEASDAESIALIRRLVAGLATTAAQYPFGPDVADSLRDLLSVGKELESHVDAATLSNLGEAVEGLQKEIRRAHKEAGAECSLNAKPANAAPTQPAAASQVVPASKERDSDTIALIGEFLSESDEGLARADQVLMGIERSGATPDAINALFRVFHTIKGVAGFLELHEIQALAHTTESLLNGCREGTFQLAGERLDLVFDATAMMRKILNDLRVAVESSREFVTGENIAGLVAKLKLALDASLDGGAAKAGERQAVAEQPTDVHVPGPEPPAEAASSSLASPVPLADTAPSGSPAPAASGAANSPGADAKIRPTIKVDLERVDRLVEMIGELVVVEAMVGGAPEIANSGSARVRNCLSQLAKVTRDLQDVGMRMRMLPVSSVFQKMARMARDVGRRAGKQVRVVLTGEQTEMDRSMVEQISDPLVHMIRNSVDHGIEPADVRRQAGKPEEGVVRMSACHEGGSVVIEIADDGRGLNRDAILKKALAQGLVNPGDTLTDDEIHSLIFAPGFSTAEKVTDISGRGVGMDVVRRNIDSMRGRITISTVPGQGTTFKITLPLTLAIIDGMLVACGDERYILPTLSVVESMKPEPSMLVTQGGSNEMLNMRGTILPLLRLDRLLGSRNGIQDPTKALVVIIEGMGKKVGVLVDEVIAQQQVVIKTMGEGIGQVRFISGAAVLADGRVGLIVNVEEIAAMTMDKKHLGFASDSPLPATRMDVFDF